jgi:hypothetical protein
VLEPVEVAVRDGGQPTGRDPAEAARPTAATEAAIAAAGSIQRMRLLMIPSPFVQSQLTTRIVSARTAAMG